MNTFDRYFEIDGSPCTSPGEISGQSYINYANVYHHPMQGRIITVKQKLLCCYISSPKKDELNDFKCQM